MNSVIRIQKWWRAYLKYKEANFLKNMMMYAMDKNITYTNLEDKLWDM